MGNKPTDPKEYNRWGRKIFYTLAVTEKGWTKWGVSNYPIASIRRLIEERKDAKKMIIKLIKDSKSSVAPYVLKYIRKNNFERHRD